MGPCLFLPKHLFHLSHHKTCWTMLVDNVGLKIFFGGTSNSMVTLTSFPRCKPKRSEDEFNNQTHTLQGLGTTSWSLVQTTPSVLKTLTPSLTRALIDNRVMLCSEPKPWNVEPYSNHLWKAITKIKPSLIEIWVPYGFLVGKRWVKRGTWRDLVASANWESGGRNQECFFI